MSQSNAMSKLSIVASSVVVMEDDPDVLAVAFKCADLGPYNYVGLERPIRPAVKDGCYALGEVSLDLDLRPAANVGCTPGAVRAVQWFPGRIVLELRDGLDPEMGDIRTIEIRHSEDASTNDRLRGVLELMFAGTSTAFDGPGAQPDQAAT